MVIKMHIDRGILTHHRADSHEIFVHPVEIFLLVPDVAIHFLLKSLQLIVVKLLLGLFERFGYERIPADVHFLGIVCTAGKGRVYVNQIYLYTLLFQIRTCRYTFAMDDHIVGVAFSDMLCFRNLIERHAANYALSNFIAFPIFKYALSTDKVVKHSLSGYGSWKIWDVFYSHSFISLAEMHRLRQPFCEYAPHRF